MYTTPDELAALADELYESSEDDDFRLAELIRGLDKNTAIKLCTSNYTNALQVYLTVFGEEPDIEIYEKLLLEPSSGLIGGIKLCGVGVADVVFGFDKSSEMFYIGVASEREIVAAFSGVGAYDAAIEWAKENCEA